MGKNARITSRNLLSTRGVYFNVDRKYECGRKIVDVASIAGVRSIIAGSLFAQFHRKFAGKHFPVALELLADLIKGNIKFPKLAIGSATQAKQGQPIITQSRRPAGSIE